MTKYKYKITGLDCYDCAKKVEEALNKNKNLKNVAINFATSKITYETNTLKIKDINKIIDKIEPGVKIVPDDVKVKKENHVLVLLLALTSAIIGLASFKYHELFTILAYLLLLYNPFLKALKMLFKSFTINENFLICISCLGAYFVNSKFEGIMVASLYMLGKILEEKALNKSRKSIQNLVELKQDYANLQVAGEITKIAVEDIKIGDILCVKKGEKIPTDGVIIKGETIFDISNLTGETRKLNLGKNQKVLSGYINLDKVILIKAETLYQDSTVAKIMELTEKSSLRKAKVETSVSRLSKIYTPIILLLAILVASCLPLLTNISYQTSIYRALTFLVIACPCAIAISVPLSYFTGIGVASKNGILIKGSNYLDNLSHLKKIIFDKTGTLTNGTFKVEKIEIIDKKYSLKEIIKILRLGESFSNHPVAQAIMNLAKEEVDTKDIKDYQELTGLGVSFKLHNDVIKIGNEKICEHCNYSNIQVHLNINSKHVASIYIDDGLKETTKQAIQELHDLGIKTYMFTGDQIEIAQAIASEVGIKEVYANMLPTDKYEKYEQIEAKQITAFVGDGVNDSPVIKRAKIGISMGGLGSDIAIDASDIVIINDDLMKIPLGIKISKYTNLVIKENLIFALSVKIIILLLSIFGLTSMWFAVFADTGVTVLTILNTLKIIWKFKTK